MQVPGPVGPAWSLRLFRWVSLVFFLVPLVVTVAFVGTGRFPQATASAISTLIFACNWNGVRRYTSSLERWALRPGYQRGTRLPDRPSDA